MSARSTRYRLVSIFPGFIDMTGKGKRLRSFVRAEQRFLSILGINLMPAVRSQLSKQ
jgi:hypothetical protein